MKRARILGLVHDRGNARKNKARSILEGLRLQLPDPVHQDVTCPHCGPDHTAGAPRVAHLEWPARIADQDTIPLRLLRVRSREAAKHANAQIVEYAAIRISLPAE